MSKSSQMPPLKTWTKTGLTERDWDFTVFCDELETAISALPDREAPFLVRRAFVWELDRELGSGNGPFDLQRELAAAPPNSFDTREREMVLMQQGPFSVKYIDPPLWLYPPRTTGGPLFSISDFQSLESLVAEFKRPSLPLTKFLLSKLAEETRNLVQVCGDAFHQLLPLCETLVRELNQIIRNGPIHDKKRFAHVRLSAETAGLLEKTLPEAGIVRLNRLLLEDAYPLILQKSSRRIEPLNTWHLGELAAYLTPETHSATRGSNCICALEIPWTQDDGEVVEGFRLWLQQHRGRQIAKPGRKPEWRTWFLHLAVYRLSAAGYTRQEALKLLGATFKKLGRGKLSPQNFAHAKKFLREEIDRRFQTMLHDADTMARRCPGQGYGDWRNHFIKSAAA